MKLSAAQLVARVRDRFDLGRQSNRHSDQSIVDKLNDCCREIRREMFDSGSRVGLSIATFDSSLPEDTLGEYPGARVDQFGTADGDFETVFAERIHSVEYINGSSVAIPEVDIAQAQSVYPGDTSTGTPVGWFPIGPVETESGDATVGVVVTPRPVSGVSFRVTFLPEMAPIQLAVDNTAPVEDIPDVGINDLLIPVEWLLCKVGVMIAIRDDDAQLVSLRKSEEQEAKSQALASIRLTSTSDMVRGRRQAPSIREINSRL